MATLPDDMTDALAYSSVRIADVGGERPWISDLHRTVEHHAAWMHQLMADAVIEFDCSRLIYRGILTRPNEDVFQCDVEMPHGNAGDYEIRQLVRERLAEAYMERYPMPDINYTTTGTPGNDTTTSTWSTLNIDDLPEPDDLTPEPPVFNMRQNTQEIELRKLRANYPAAIFHTNYQQLPHQALETQRQVIREAIEHVRRVQCAQIAYEQSPTRLRHHLTTMFSAHISPRDMRFVRTPEADIRQQMFYSRAIEFINDYRNSRDNFLVEQGQYADIQARYNQQAALIRQRPQLPISIPVGYILETLIQWEHVWGVAATICPEEDNTLIVRVGLSNIVMSESATETNYDYKADIMLAPFYFTIRLDGETGRFRCPSGHRNVLGLSRSYAPGTVCYDIHPHQLSDTPCFGSFGQTLVDTAAQGDVLSLVGGIIAFYSQYNSRDSAGVEATNWHPGNLMNISDPDQYMETLVMQMTRFSEYHVLDENKLDQDIAAYIEYHGHTRSHESPPEVAGQRCYECDEVCVNDDYEYYVTNNGERICPGCWHDHYCGGCENHCENCTCEPEEY